MLINGSGRSDTSYSQFCPLKTSWVKLQFLFPCQVDLRVYMLSWSNYKFDGACIPVSQIKETFHWHALGPTPTIKNIFCVCGHSHWDLSALQQLVLLILTNENRPSITPHLYPQCWTGSFPIQQLQWVEQNWFQIKSDYNPVSHRVRWN